MKALKTISAVLLSVAVILSFAACHKKGETVMTVGETKIDSGLYLAFQYNAYNQFISDVGSDPDNSIPSSVSYSYFNDFSHPEDGTPRLEWIEQKTKELCKEYGAVWSFANRTTSPFLSPRRTPLLSMPPHIGKTRA